MALTRKLLESMGLESDKVETIIEAHAETVNGLKAKLEQYKDDADAYAQTKTKLEKAEKELAELKQGGDDWQAKYEKEKADFAEYKKETESKALMQEKSSAYKKMLKETGVSEKAIELILKSADLASVELEDGKIKDADKHAEAIKKEYSDFIVSENTQGANTSTPPANNAGALKEVYKKNDKGRYELSTAERQKAIAESLANNQ